MSLNLDQRKLIEIQDIINEALSLEITEKINSPNRRVKMFFYIKTKISVKNLIQEINSLLKYGNTKVKKNLLLQRM